MSTALLIIDVQNDFCRKGSLEVPGAEEIIPYINGIMDDFEYLVFTQDWHPENHCSFDWWPIHCVQNTKGARLHKLLRQDRQALIVRKGQELDVDSYSAFYDNDHYTSTGLTDWLTTARIEDLTLVGLATDFCVGFSALDAVADNFNVTVDLKGCRGINIDGSEHAMIQRMSKAGITLK